MIKQVRNTRAFTLEKRQRDGVTRRPVFDTMFNKNCVSRRTAGHACLSDCSFASAAESGATQRRWGRGSRLCDQAESLAGRRSWRRRRRYYSQQDCQSAAEKWHSGGEGQRCSYGEGERGGKSWYSSEPYSRGKLCQSGEVCGGKCHSGEERREEKQRYCPIRAAITTSHQSSM